MWLHTCQWRPLPPALRAKAPAWFTKRELLSVMSPSLVASDAPLASVIGPPRSVMSPVIATALASVIAAVLLAEPTSSPPSSAASVGRLPRSSGALKLLPTGCTTRRPAPLNPLVPNTGVSLAQTRLPLPITVAPVWAAWSPRVSVPLPCCCSVPAPVMAPLWVMASLRLNTTLLVALVLMAPDTLPLVPPVPICSTPRSSTVPPVWVALPVMRSSPSSRQVLARVSRPLPVMLPAQVMLNDESTEESAVSVTSPRTTSPKPLLPSSTPPASTRVLSMMARSSQSVAPLATVMGPLPKAVRSSLPAPPNSRPALTVLPPLKVLAAASSSVPLPYLERLPLPLITPAYTLSPVCVTVSVWPLPSCTLPLPLRPASVSRFSAAPATSVPARLMPPLPLRSVSASSVPRLPTLMAPLPSARPMLIWLKPSTKLLLKAVAGTLSTPLAPPRPTVVVALAGVSVRLPLDCR